MLEYQYFYQNKAESYYWNYIDTFFLCEDEYSIVALGHLAEDKVNFARVKYGEGHFVYTSYSWFRELPAGVPGAYRLFVNMISLGNEMKP